MPSLKFLSWSVLLIAAESVSAQPTNTKLQPKIDRKALVGRHSVVNAGFDSLGALLVGNGEFAFTVDPTGLQTFPDFYKKRVR